MSGEDSPQIDEVSRPTKEQKESRSKVHWLLRGGGMEDRDKSKKGRFMSVGSYASSWVGGVRGSEDGEV